MKRPNHKGASDTDLGRARQNTYQIATASTADLLALFRRVMQIDRLEDISPDALKLAQEVVKGAGPPATRACLRVVLAQIAVDATAATDLRKVALDEGFAVLREMDRLDASALRDQVKTLEAEVANKPTH